MQGFLYDKISSLTKRAMNVVQQAPQELSVLIPSNSTKPNTTTKAKDGSSGQMAPIQASALLVPSTLATPEERLVFHFQSACEIMDTIGETLDEPQSADADRKLYASKGKEHLKAMVILLRDESDKWYARYSNSPDPEISELPCLTTLLQTHVLHALCNRACRDLPRGSLPMILGIIASLLRCVRYPLLPHQTVHRPIAHLITVAWRYEVFHNHGLSSQSKAEFISYRKRIDIGLTSLLIVLWRKISENPPVINAFKIVDSRRRKSLEISPKASGDSPNMDRDSDFKPQIDILSALVSLLFKLKVGPHARDTIVIALSMHDVRVNAFLLYHAHFIEEIICELIKRFTILIDFMHHEIASFSTKAPTPLKSSSGPSSNAQFASPSRPSNTATSRASVSKPSNLTVSTNNSFYTPIKGKQGDLLALFEKEGKSPLSSPPGPSTSYPSSGSIYPTTPRQTETKLSPIDSFYEILRFMDVIYHVSDPKPFHDIYSASDSANHSSKDDSSSHDNDFSSFQSPNAAKSSSDASKGRSIGKNLNATTPSMKGAIINSSNVKNTSQFIDIYQHPHNTTIRTQLQLYFVSEFLQKNLLPYLQSNNEQQVIIGNAIIIILFDALNHQESYQYRSNQTFSSLLFTTIRYLLGLTESIAESHLKTDYEEIETENMDMTSFILSFSERKRKNTKKSMTTTPIKYPTHEMATPIALTSMESFSLNKSHSIPSNSSSPQSFSQSNDVPRGEFLSSLLSRCGSVSKRVAISSIQVLSSILRSTTLKQAFYVLTFKSSMDNQDNHMNSSIQSFQNHLKTSIQSKDLNLESILSKIMTNEINLSIESQSHQNINAEKDILLRIQCEQSFESSESLISSSILELMITKIANILTLTLDEQLTIAMFVSHITCLLSGNIVMKLGFQCENIDESPSEGTDPSKSSNLLFTPEKSSSKEIQEDSSRGNIHYELIIMEYLLNLLNSLWISLQSNHFHKIPQFDWKFKAIQQILSKNQSSSLTLDTILSHFIPNYLQSSNNIVSWNYLSSESQFTPATTPNAANGINSMNLSPMIGNKPKTPTTSSSASISTGSSSSSRSQWIETAAIQYIKVLEQETPQIKRIIESAVIIKSLYQNIQAQLFAMKQLHQLLQIPLKLHPNNLFREDELFKNSNSNVSNLNSNILNSNLNLNEFLNFHDDNFEQEEEKQELLSIQNNSKNYLSSNLNLKPLSEEENYELDDFNLISLEIFQGNEITCEAFLKDIELLERKLEELIQ